MGMDPHSWGVATIRSLASMGCATDNKNVVSSSVEPERAVRVSQTVGLALGGYYMKQAIQTVGGICNKDIIASWWKRWWKLQSYSIYTSE